MKVCIDGIIQDIIPPENEPVVEKPVFIEDEITEIKVSVNRLIELLTPIIKHLGG